MHQYGQGVGLSLVGGYAESKVQICVLLVLIKLSPWSSPLLLLFADHPPLF